MRIAKVGFKEPYLGGADCEVLALAVMRLLMKCAYNTGSDYGKFTIGYVMQIPRGEVSYTIGRAISLEDSVGNVVPNMDVYAMIDKVIRSQAEDYEKAVISGVFIRVYLAGRHESLERELALPLSSDEISSQIWQLITAGIGGGERREVKAIGGKRRYPDHVPALKPKSKERRPFIVADTETILQNNIRKRLTLLVF